MNHNDALLKVSANQRQIQHSAKNDMFLNFFASDSDFTTFMHLLKSNMGPPLLAMPFVFMHGGIVFSPIAFIFVAMLLSFNAFRMVQCAVHLSAREGSKIKTYASVAFVAFNTCSETTKHYAATVKTSIDFLFILTRIDACAIFAVFVGRNIGYMIKFFGVDPPNIRTILFLEMCPMILLNMTPISYQASISTLSNLTIISCIGLIIGFYLVHDIQSPWTRYLYRDFFSTIRFVCVILFALSGLSVSITMQSNMRTPEHFLSCPGVFCFAIVLLVVLYDSVGLLGYLKYGEDTTSSVMFNLPNSEMLSIVIKFLLLMAVFLTIPIVFYIAFKSLEGYTIPYLDHSSHAYANFLTKTGLTAAIFIRSVIAPNLGPMITLKGALFHSLLEVIFPPIIYLVAFYPEEKFGHCYINLILTFIITCFGALIFVVGTTAAILDFIEYKYFANDWNPPIQNRSFF